MPGGLFKSCLFPGAQRLQAGGVSPKEASRSVHVFGARQPAWAPSQAHGGHRPGSLGADVSPQRFRPSQAAVVTFKSVESPCTHPFKGNIFENKHTDQRGSHWALL